MGPCTESLRENTHQVAIDRGSYDIAHYTAVPKFHVDEKMRKCVTSKIHCVQRNKDPYVRGDHRLKVN